MTFKLTVNYNVNFFYLLLNEIIILHAGYFGLIWLQKNLILSKKNILPLFNVLLITLLLVLVFEFALIALLPSQADARFDFVQRLILVLLSSIIFGLILYVFAILVKFFFYKQKGNPKGYYRAMLILLLIAGFMDTFRPYWTSDSDLRSLFPTFFGWLDSFYSLVEIALILIIVFNSFRVAWIAKLTKKEKVGLILRSFAVSVLFMGAITLFFQYPQIEKIADKFSPFVFTAASTILLFGAVNSGVIFFTTIFHLPTAEESDKKTEELSMLWSFGKLVNQIFDVNELADSIVSLAKQITNTEKIWLEIELNENRIFTSGKIDAEVARNISAALKKNEPLDKPVTINVLEKPKLSFLAEFNVERLLVVPFEVKGEIKGNLFLARSFDEEIFDDDEITSIVGLADYASLAIEKAELLQASIEKERMEKELELAREIQRKIIPVKYPELENYEISAQFIPAFEVGGDYFDFFEINGRIAFVIADVSGKGIEASYIMAEMKGIFEALSSTEEAVEKLIANANSIFYKRLRRKNFVTAIVGIIDEKEILYYRIGHNLPIVIRDEKVELIESKGLAFGLTDEKAFAKNLEPKRIELKKGETIVFYTDGVNEAMNDKNEEFGYERLKDVLRKNANGDAKEIGISVIKAVSVFAERKIQNDDITLVIVKKK